MRKKSHFERCLLLIILALILVMPLGSVGCKKVTAQEVSSNVLDAYSKSKTYSVEENVTAVTNVVGGDRPGTRSTSQNSTGTIDIEGRRFEINVMQDGSPLSGLQTFSRVFLENEWLYIKGDILNYEDRDHEILVKLDLGDEQLNRGDRLWKDNNPLGQQIELLNTATEITSIRNESINGISAYVLDIKPDWQVLADWLSLQPPWRGPRLFDLPELTKSLTFRVWVSKDTYSILKSTIEVEFEMVSFDLSKSIVELKAEMKFNDYDEPVNIKLPQEALEAVEGPIA